MGAKPVRGGRPPRERRISGARALRAGNLAQEVARVLTLAASNVLNVRNAEDVMTIYVVRARIVREGLN